MLNSTFEFFLKKSVKFTKSFYLATSEKVVTEWRWMCFVSPTHSSRISRLLKNCNVCNLLSTNWTDPNPVLPSTTHSLVESPTGIQQGVRPIVTVIHSNQLDSDFIPYLISCTVQCRCFNDETSSLPSLDADTAREQLALQ